MIEINKDRLIRYFTDLVRISSPSWKEHEVFDYITDVLDSLNVTYEKHACGESFNLLVRIEGDDSRPSILFSSHVDTVGPCDHIKPIVTQSRITLDGTSILGSDDKSAVAAFLEGVTCLRERSLSHGPIEILFSCAEEIGLEGAKGFDMSLLRSRIGFVFDSSGPVGKVVWQAPYHSTMEVTVTGRAAHAGIEPEKGINAIKVLAEMITALPSGRLDKQTTMNVGLISGGRATNIVPESAVCKLEIRSLDRKKLVEQEKRARAIIAKIASRRKSRAKIKYCLEYSGFTVSRDEPASLIVAEALKKIRIKPKFETSGGGSDTNIFSRHGIKALNLSSGMQKVHTTDEFITIDDLTKCARLMLAIIETV